MVKTLRNLIIPALFIVFGVSASAQVTVVSPNGGEIWTDGNSSLIAWTNSGQEDWFIIEFSADNGSTWWEIEYAYGYPGANEIYYNGMLEATTEGKIRISNYYYPGIFDESDGTFTVVVPAYYIYYPSQGQMYYPGEEIYVQWNTSNMNPVNIDLSTDNGSTWNQMGAEVTSYYYSFTAPDVISDQCILRLSDATDSTVSATGNTFSIVTPPVVTVTSPNGNEVWEYGEYYTITWTGENLNSYVAIELSADGGETWQQQWWSETSATGGSVEVTAPMVPTQNARVRVSDYYYPDASDASDADFTINSPAYLIYSPYPLSVYYSGEEILVQWSSYIQANTDIAISTDNGNTFQTVLTDVPSYPQYAYISAPDQPSDNCIIRLSVAGDPDLFGLSEPFRIIALPELTLTFPAGGEILDNDSTYFIKWNLTGELLYSTYLSVEYSPDNGATWNNIGWLWDAGNQDSLEWRTPIQVSDNCLVRISDYYNSLISAQSQSVFAIRDIPALEICMVSVDSASGKNTIIWNKVQSELIAEYVVLKESNVANEYVEVGSVGTAAASILVDENSDPAEKATRYKLTFRDQEGNLYGTGSLHQTIHLSINKGVGSNWNLYWNNYLGFPVSSYNIYRGTNPGDMTMIGTVSGNFTSYTDQNAPAGFVYYMIEVLNPNQCDPEGSRTGDYNSTKSNIATNKTLGFREGELSGLSVYPNPAIDIIRIKSSEALRGDVTITVVSIFGQIVKTFSVDGSEINKGYELNTSGLSQGVYSIVIRNEQSSGIIRFIRQD